MNIKGIDIKENLIYGKRHIEFNQKQQTTINESIKVYESATYEIIKIVETVTTDLKQFQKKLKQDLSTKKMTEKLETRKDEYIGIEKKREEKLKFEKSKRLT